MDFELATNDETKVLKFANFKQFGSGDGSTLLAVRSGPFGVSNFPFHFDSRSLSTFLASLKEMNHSLQGETAVLKPLYEDQLLCFQMLPNGKVWVSGKVQQYNEKTQVLTFAFLTDQTCLNGLINFLEKCVDLTPEGGT